ncbi:MAG: FAD-dependent oxidoreductase [Myxococcota bacterium]
MASEGPRAAVQFRHLFTPLRIGTFTVRNRILSTAHFTGYAKQGLPSERHLSYWASKAKGGIGLIVTEVQPVGRTGGRSPSMIQCYRDEVIGAFRPIVKAVHDHGARLVAQIWHPGSGSFEDGSASWTVSGSTDVEAVPESRFTAAGASRAVSVEEIRQVISGYGEAAARMREADLDGVEIHSAHGYLPEQFMSSLTNRRSDEYGGSEEERVRFVVEVIDSVRDAVGPDYTVGIRISGDQFRSGGLSLDDMKRIVGTITASGKLDYVNVSYSGAGGAVIAPNYVPPGQFVYLAAGIKEITDLPVFCIGRINDPVMAEHILERHQADMIGMTRANICDPELPDKAREGRLDEIRRCIACNEGCWGHVMTQQAITCAINASVGREKESEIRPAKVRRKVMVVGGGIAGMEATRVAAERGHRVVLYEKEPHLGGQLHIASRAPGRQDMAEPARYYELQFRRLGVEVQLGASVDADLVRELAPDAVIVATGGTPRAPDFQGSDGPNVVQARDVLMGRCEVGQKAVVYAGDEGMEGLTTADFLASRGKQVEMIVPDMSVGTQVEMLTRMTVLMRLGRQGVAVSPMLRLRSFENRTVTVGGLFGGPGRSIENVDTVVVALGSQANNELFTTLRGEVKDLRVVGESHAPRRMEHSALEGLRAGLAV